jgi:hypothetical protein
MAMAAMIRMIATTIKSSMSENPLALLSIQYSSTVYGPAQHEAV